MPEDGADNVLGELLEYHLHRAATTGRFSIDIDYWDDPDVGEDNRWQVTLMTGEDPDSDSGFHWATHGRAATGDLLPPHMDIEYMPLRDDGDESGPWGWQSRVPSSRVAIDEQGVSWPIVAETPARHAHLLSEAHDWCGCADGEPDGWVDDYEESSDD